MNLDFYIKLRDAAQMIADACQEELEKHDPTTPTAQSNINHEKIPWVRVNNQKGEPYERYPAYQQQADETNKEYVSLREKLKKSKFYQNGGLRYWLFQDDTTIGRKPKTTTK